MVGATAVRTNTLAVQVTAPAEFSAVIVTVTGPGGTMAPAAGDCERVTLQPVAKTSLSRLGMTASQFAFAVIVLFAAQVVMIGGLAGVTVTVKLQVAPSVLLQVTTVLPTGKVEPEVGLQVTVPQLPEVVGVE